MEAADGMGGGKRNHDDLSDMMALVEAACNLVVFCKSFPKSSCTHCGSNPSFAPYARATVCLPRPPKD